MEPLLKQLRELPARFTALSSKVRLAMLGGLGAVVVAALVAVFAGESSAYQYAFTNLTAEDASEAAGVLKANGISFRSEAGGSALAVPASKVHEVRLLLAASGLPRGGGVGFEIFDRGDLGISEFTQKVNLRRAIEGELSRTIGRLSQVRSARVHITLPEKGLYRSEERKAAAAVVLNLQPGRTVDERELAGVRHLVSAAVAGLAPESVTVVDGRGTVLAGDRSDGAKLVSEQREMETGLEQRIVDLLEPVVGRGAVVAKVTASLDSREVESTQDAYDPEAQAVRSERKVTEQIGSDQSAPGGVAGAAANQPLNPAAGGAAGGSRSQTNREDTLKNYEISKTTTRTVARAPRLQRLSAAVLISGQDGKPRGEAELRRLGELAKHAVGFDEKRGDRFDISSAPFAIDPNATEAPLALWERPGAWKIGAGSLLFLLLLGGGLAALLVRKRRSGSSAAEVAMLRPGSKVSELEAAFTNAAALPAANMAKLTQAAARAQLGPAPAVAVAGPGGVAVAGEAGGPVIIGDVTQIGADGSLPGSEVGARGARKPSEMVLRARKLTEADPQRAAHLLRAWIAMDFEKDKPETPAKEQKSA
jgi:flagellar M-ring protein FliF